jgi:hypothetical protein
LGEFVSRGVLSLSFSFLLLWFAAFRAMCGFAAFFLLLDDHLELFFGFWSSSCASYGIGFKVQTLCICVVNVLIQMEIERPSG